MIIKEFANAYHPASTLISVWLWNFKDGGMYLKRKNFGQESTVLMEKIKRICCWISVRQNLGLILENKVIQKLMLQNKVFQKNSLLN